MSSHSKSKINVSTLFFLFLSLQLRINIIVLCTLAVPIIAVITKSDLRREAGFDTYGPPPREGPQLPVAVYGAPAQHKYPPPPPGKQF